MSELTWESLGDLQAGRPNLGALMRVEVYRLMQFALHEVLDKTFGEDSASQLIYDAGRNAGILFSRHVVGEHPNITEYVRHIQEAMFALGIGVVRFEKTDMVLGEIVLTVSEDLECSGTPNTGRAICSYDEGFIAGLLESITGKTFIVKEIDCWAMGGQICRFQAIAV